VSQSTKPEFPPLLAPGFHEVTASGLRQLCVTPFPSSLTRATIMDGLESVLARLTEVGLQGELWADGSFLTEKLSPDDVDALLCIKGDVYHDRTGPQHEVISWVQGNLYDSLRCDTYVFVDGQEPSESEWWRAYWIRQFGWTRSDRMKGIALMRLCGGTR